ncbi:DUF2771 domain-containing protein [Streptomyces sp. MS06]|uniref:DUF2771 domain-containing protein n=1 Tax=Streptomyces sp. MS06 TaxID=3385974 RepID=UPI00399F9108
MTMLQSVVRRRRAVAAAGAVSAGLLVLSACDKPTPITTLTVGTDTVHAQAVCYNDGKELKTAGLTKCLKANTTLSVDPDKTVRIGVDPEIADNGWTILMNGRPLVDTIKKTYTTIPGSVFFTEAYGATGNSTIVSIREGDDKGVTGIWTFKLTKKDS